MSHSSPHDILVSRGRKAGLRTNELYGALTMRPSEGRDPAVGRSDGNGYVTTYNDRGQRIYSPSPEEPQA